MQVRLRCYCYQVWCPTDISTGLFHSRYFEMIPGPSHYSNNGSWLMGHWAIMSQMCFICAIPTMIYCKNKKCIVFVIYFCRVQRFSAPIDLASTFLVTHTLTRFSQPALLCWMMSHTPTAEAVSYKQVKSFPLGVLEKSLICKYIVYTRYKCHVTLGHLILFVFLLKLWDENSVTLGHVRAGNTLVSLLTTYLVTVKNACVAKMSPNQLARIHTPWRESVSNQPFIALKCSTTWLASFHTSERRLVPKQTVELHGF